MSNSLQASVRPPDGYEPKPRNPPPYTFELLPGQDITARRITRVSITVPATVRVSAGRISVRGEIEIDTGQVESPYIDAFSLNASDSSVLKASFSLDQKSTCRLKRA